MPPMNSELTETRSCSKFVNCDNADKDVVDLAIQRRNNFRTQKRVIKTPP